jgi:haloacetate dehalogenase
MFEQFERREIETAGAKINLVVGGEGPPLLLVHGYPQTHVMWHQIAPRLAESYTVVAPDLRGYGDSSKPPSGDKSSNYSKRAMAQDLVEVMSTLGFERFRLAGHDRGGRVSYRLAFDHPERVERLALLDIVATWEQLEQVDTVSAYGTFHWYFMGQPAGFPERMIGADPEFYLRYLVDKWAASPDPFAPEAMAEYLRCFSNPETIRATCDCYRNNPEADYAHDDADRSAGRKIECPTLVLWGGGGRVHKGRRILETWSNWASDLRGKGLSCGHFLAEELPDETFAELSAFFAGE